MICYECGNTIVGPAERCRCRECFCGRHCLQVKHNTVLCDACDAKHCEANVANYITFHSLNIGGIQYKPTNSTGYIFCGAGCKTRYVTEYKKIIKF